jgi:hypothetical protein
MNESTKRVIVIGSEGHYGVDSTSWTTEGMPNIADYDTVIIDTSSFDSILEQARTDETYRAANIKLLRRISSNLDFVRDRLVNLLNSEGIVYAICSHHCRSPISTYSSVSNYQWSPLPIDTINEHGVTNRVLDETLNHYFQFVKEWSFYFSTEYTYSSLSEIVDFYRKKHYVRPMIIVLAENRYKRPLALSLFYQLYEVNNQRDLERAIESPSEFDTDKNQPLFMSGLLHLLPPTTLIDRKEAINLLIEDFLSIQQKTPPPFGIDDILVPGESSMKRGIQENLIKIEELRAIDSELRAGRDEKTQYKQLIYETGPPLEEICKLTFVALGCEVDDSVEDFILSKGDKEAIVEVKGREGTILRQDGTQLAQNRRNYITENDKDMREVKAILLGNPFRLEFPIEERVKKEPFAPHLVRDAEVEAMALVSTVELFNAYCAFLEGKVTSDDIINRLFVGVGITHLLHLTKA